MEPQHDIKALYNCALVCRSWLAASRLRLFSSIFLTARRYELFHHTLCSSASMQPWLGHVFEIVIRDGHAGVHNSERRSQRLIHDFAGQLPGLRALTLRSCDWKRRPPHPSAFRMLSAFPALRTLVLHSCMFPTFRSLCHMISSSPHLTTLRMSDVEWPPTPVHWHASAPVTTYTGSRSRPALTHCTVSASGPPRIRYEDFFRWLSTTPTTVSLVEFSCYEHGKAWSTSTVEFLSRAARTVRCIKQLSLTDLHRLPIAALVELRALTLRLDAQDPWAPLASAFGIFEGHHLRELTLENAPVQEEPQLSIGATGSRRWIQCSRGKTIQSSRS
ncbi:hypothetical protein C8Q80DRAFT_1276374 [Daedaleopsis nitida]|nr:hypothetical protein C8Q80DRAFT_1276374 [Daedaleopsis nitida]